MNASCPNSQCAFHNKNVQVIKDGFYFRKDDSRKIPRFLCKVCGKRFSASTVTLEWKQKKRRVNSPMFKLLSSGVSMRRAALILNVHQITVARKLVYLAKKAELSQQELLAQLQNSPVTHMQFDDLITSEHTKLKPLAVSVAVDAKRRLILGVQVSSIGPFGHLAHLSRKKYGKRKNNHVEKLSDLLTQIQPAISENVLIETDEHKRYPEIVSQLFPTAIHKRYKGGRGSIVGQGELKKLNYDPLFKINHTCAMLRANINRITRRTWCTTKKAERLQSHLQIFIQFFNQILLKDKLEL